MKNGVITVAKGTDENGCTFRYYYCTDDEGSDENSALFDSDFVMIAPDMMFTCQDNGTWTPSISTSMFCDGKLSL